MKITTLKHIQDLAEAMVKSAVENGEEFDIARTTKALLPLLDNASIYADIEYEGDSIVSYMIAAKQENPFNGKIIAQEMASELPEAHKSTMLARLELWAVENKVNQLVIMTDVDEIVPTYLPRQAVQIKTIGG